MTPTPPQLSSEQRHAASQLAVANRRRRADIKRALKAGDLTLAEVFVIADQEDCVAQMRASDLIAAIPAIGEVKASRIMRQAQIAATRRIRGLGARQRSELLKALAR